MRVVNVRKGVKGFVCLPVEDRFWANVDRSGGGCWIWLGATNGYYGQIRVAGRNKKAHHVAWCLVHGEIPAGMKVLHRCDNPACVRPHHLFLGTQQDNIRDAKNKGRLATGDRNGSRIHPGSLARGERNGQSKLTTQEVAAIRDLAASGIPRREIAARFGIHRTGVGEIVRRVRWAHS